MDTPYVIEPEKLYNEKWILNFLQIEHETLVKNYIKSNRLRCLKRGNNYFFPGQWLIDDLITFETEVEK